MQQIRKFDVFKINYPKQLIRIHIVNIEVLMNFKFTPGFYVVTF